MSPRRMDISSLLRDPSPPRPSPPSLLSLLNVSDRNRNPFIALDVLVHAASEERRRLDSDHAPNHRPHKRSRSPSPAYPTLPRPSLDDSHSTTHPASHYPPPFPRHPQHFRPSPTHFPPHPISPRHGGGPKMAGGIEILSNDPPRLDLSPFQSPRHDLSPERLVSEARAEHPPPRLSPLSTRQLHHIDTDWPRPRPPPLSSPSTDNPRTSFTPEFPPFERHPIRVWEDQPPRMQNRQPTSPERRRWSGASEGLLPVKRDITDIVPTSPSFTYEAQPPPRVSTPEYALHDETSPDCSCRQYRSPALSDFHLPPVLHPPASPVIELGVRTSGTQFEHQSPPSPSAATSSDPVVAESISAKIVPPLDDVPVASPPSPAFTIQPALAEQSGTLDASTYPTPLVTPSHDTSRSPSQPPSIELLPDENIVIQPDSTRQSREPEDTFEREPPAMMDVDEELLSLVEDRPVHVIPPTPKVQILPILPDQVATGSAERCSNESSDDPSLEPSSQLIPTGSLLVDEEKDRASMPPPAARNKKDKTTGSKKKKDATSKPAAKAKQTAKPRAKAAPKAKTKPNGSDASSKGTIPKVITNVNARSRSTSVIPSILDEVIPEPDPVDSDKEDDKFYCVCKTRYDEDKTMIACDRCDEWFHTLCVNMPDLEIDLVDQFICPPCIQKSPHLRTTWKRRCLFGLQHENSSSPEACHKPSRGAFSKYCSDDCGIKFMRARIARWETTGGARDLLWDSVKNAAKREGVVVCSVTNGTNVSEMDVDDHKPLDSAAKRKADRAIARLNTRLEEVVKERELMKRELDMVIWREKVVDLGSERAGKMDECGWDQRLCFGEEEWADFGPEVLESYEEERVKVESGSDTPDATSPVHGEWWCTGKKKCRRHAGWQKLRAAEVSFDRETKEGTLLKLTSREREIRKSIEDILYPQPTGTLQACSYSDT